MKVRAIDLTMARASEDESARSTAQGRRRRLRARSGVSGSLCRVCLPGGGGVALIKRWQVAG
jgi:hypothetical protein